ncbi:hypothetical protein PHYBOEH_009898 [Phytophthora boehmeriae]|uniref:DNA polymerase delta subunit 3 n=1 Tax=Phytophthora boehmeriae TaxID=109152 RepID=A0A8T1WYM6_9STRA|nr:hypothetical protein PHYBOEH_009898 [Phytophthora boehmeriae]
MDRCLEEISSTVLDAGEPLSHRTLSVRSHAPSTVSVAALAQFSSENSSVKALQVLITQASISTDDDSETAAAKRDPRARAVRLAVGPSKREENVLCQQIYALFSQSNGDNDAEEEATVVATACWAQERQTRNDVFAQWEKHAPLSAAAKALYSSGISCAEVSARQDFGEEQGEETVSAFDTINASAKKKTSGASFFKSSGKTGPKSSSSSKNGTSNGNKTPAKKQEVKVNAASMSNVLTIDSDDEEDDETDAPVFVKKTSTSGRGKRVISDDDDEEDEAPVKKPASTPAPKSRNVKRKLNASPAEVKKAKKQASDSEEEVSSKKKEDSEDESPEVVPSIPTKRQVLVTKTRINEQGYMVTEKTYEEVELTPEEIEKEKKTAQKKLEEKKRKAAAEKAAKVKREAKKQSGPPKQRDLRSFFSAK